MDTLDTALVGDIPVSHDSDGFGLVPPP
jgi:hypothetical protein